MSDSKSIDLRAFSDKPATDVVSNSVHNFLLNSLKKALEAAEDDIKTQTSNTQNLNDFRRSSVKTLEFFPDIFKGYNQRLPANTPSQIAFAVDLFVESVVKTHDSDLSIFTARWDVVSAGLPPELKRAPLDIRRFIISVYDSMLRAAMTQQNIMISLISLEREFLHGLGLVLFESNSILLDAMPRRHDSQTKDSESSTNDAALFHAICDVISFFDPETDVLIPMDGAYSGPIANKPIPQEDMSKMLSELQKWVPKVLEDALGQEPGKLGDSIKQVLIRRAETFGAPRGSTILNPDDEHAVNLVDGAFHQNLMQRKMQSASRAIMAQMLFPSVKAAILDRQWFSKNEHPARKLLESITTACTSKDGSEPPQDVMKKASETVDRLVAGFNEDVSMFEELAKEMQDYMSNRTSLKEPTPTTGKKDISWFITKCREELVTRWTGRSTPQKVRYFATTIGSMYLANLDQSGLRGTGQWVAAINSMDSLIDMKSSAGKPVPIDGSLRASLISILASQGLSGVRAHHALAELEDSIHQFRVLGLDPPPAPDMLPGLTITEDIEKMRDVKNIEVKSENLNEIVSNDTPKKPFMVGTLWKMIDSHGDTIVVKLNWVSPITSKHLFTNQKGGRELVATESDIENMIASGLLKKSD